MGCEFSKYSVNTRRGTLNSRRNTLVAKPNASVRVGEGIKLGDQHGTKIVFIFGGPGSGKGTIVNNLIDMYNFQFVCGEDLILEQLSKKLLPESSACMGTTATRQLQKLLNEDSSQLTLHWVLELIDKEISKHTGKTVVVDMVPNLKFLLKAPDLVKECCTEMKAFEEKHPIAFAINLALDEDHLLQNINQTHACTKPPKQDNKQGKDGEQSSDEMDTSRTQRRFNIYLDSVKPFLTYFGEDDKLLTVDTSCGRVDSVWESLRDYVMESELASPVNCIDQVILFKMNESDFEEVDFDRYPMCCIQFKDLLKDHTSASPSELLKRLCFELRGHATRWKTFLVDVIGTKLCSSKNIDNFPEKNLVFLEDAAGQLDFFIHGIKRKSERKKSFLRKQEQIYNSIATGENEILVFPRSCETSHCRQIGMCYLQVK